MARTRPRRPEKNESPRGRPRRRGVMIPGHGGPASRRIAPSSGPLWRGPRFRRGAATRPARRRHGDPFPPAPPDNSGCFRDLTATWRRQRAWHGRATLERHVVASTSGLVAPEPQHAVFDPVVRKVKAVGPHDRRRRVRALGLQRLVRTGTEGPRPFRPFEAQGLQGAVRAEGRCHLAPAGAGGHVAALGGLHRGSHAK